MQRGGEGVEALGGQGGEVAFFEFLLDGGEFGREDAGPGLPVAEEAIFEVVQFDGGLVLDFKTAASKVNCFLKTAFEERAAGDAQFGGDANQAPALGATLDKFLTSFRSVHNQ